MRVLSLTGSHDRQGADCGRQELNDWLRQIARQHQDKGLGELLLVDALTRAQRTFIEAGGIGLFVDAIDEQAAAYCLRYGYTAAPDNPLQQNSGVSFDEEKSPRP